MLQVDNMVKKYGALTVLEVPSLQLCEGIFWLKGANGSGKTTFLKMIAGLLPFEGDIKVNNISLKQQPLRYRQQISWSEAEPLFPFFMRGTDIITLYRNIRNASKTETDKLVALFTMHDYINDAIGTYSAGMIKKLSLLLSFIGKPSLILLDEPLITLDADAVTIVLHLITEKYKTNGSSFLISSHQDIKEQDIIFNAEFFIQNKTILTA